MTVQVLPMKETMATDVTAMKRVITDKEYSLVRQSVGTDAETILTEEDVEDHDDDDDVAKQVLDDTAEAEDEEEDDDDVTIERVGNENLLPPSILKKESSTSLPSSPKGKCKKQVNIKRTSSSVSFNSITIREYDLTLGDHPDCSWGPPLSLDWDFDEVHEGCVIQYEEQRAPKRKPRQMVQSSIRRKAYLKSIGYTDEDIEVATKNVGAARTKRFLTRKAVSVIPLESAFESACRKFKRVLSKTAKEKKKRDDDFVHQYSNLTC